MIAHLGIVCLLGFSAGMEDLPKVDFEAINTRSDFTSDEVEWQVILELPDFDTEMVLDTVENDYGEIYGLDEDTVDVRWLVPDRIIWVNGTTHELGTGLHKNQLNWLLCIEEQGGLSTLFKKEHYSFGRGGGGRYRSHSLQFRFVKATSEISMLTRHSSIQAAFDEEEAAPLLRECELSGRPTQDVTFLTEQRFPLSGTTLGPPAGAKCWFFGPWAEVDELAAYLAAFEAEMLSDGEPDWNRVLTAETLSKQQLNRMERDLIARNPDQPRDGVWKRRIAIPFVVLLDGLEDL